MKNGFKLETAKKLLLQISVIERDREETERRRTKGQEKEKKNIFAVNDFNYKSASWISNHKCNFS